MLKDGAVVLAGYEGLRGQHGSEMDETGWL